MSRVNYVKSARKDNKALGIKKGDEYWWWQDGFRGPKRVSKTPPSRAETASSDYYRQLYAIVDDLTDALPGESVDDIKSMCEDAANYLRELAAEQEEKLDNMPDGLREGDTGQLLEER